MPLFDDAYNPVSEAAEIVASVAFCAPRSVHYDIPDPWAAWNPPDRPFRNYTPFPKLDAAERKARAAGREADARLRAAWRSLRGDRDPFGEGCDNCGW